MKEILIRPFVFSKDKESVLSIINSHVSSVLNTDYFVLPVSEEQLFKREKFFFVLENLDTQAIMACVSYWFYRSDLVEIRTLLVNVAYRKKGWGTHILLFLETHLKNNLSVSRTFVLTSAPQFFLKNGYLSINKELIYEKVWKDCQSCKYQYNCKEISLIKHI